MARALENQCVVVHATTVGPADWLPVAGDEPRRRGDLCPARRGFPEDGVIASGKPDAAGWVLRRGLARGDCARCARRTARCRPSATGPSRPSGAERMPSWRHVAARAASDSVLKRALRPFRPGGSRRRLAAPRRGGGIALGRPRSSTRAGSSCWQQSWPASSRSPSSTASTRSTHAGLAPSVPPIVPRWSSSSRSNSAGVRTGQPRASAAPRQVLPRQPREGAPHRGLEIRAVLRGRASAAPASSPAADLARRAPPRPCPAPASRGSGSARPSGNRRAPAPGSCVERGRESRRRPRR